MALKNSLLSFLLFVSVLFCCATATAQGNNYVMHTLKSGETLSALAKEFNTTVGDIMRLNGMHADSQLKLGDQIKIPSSGSATTSTTKTATAQTHVVAQGESLFRISKMYNVSLAQLQQWNNLPDYSIQIGQTLLVSEGTRPGSASPTTTKKTETASAPEVKQQPEPVQPSIKETTTSAAPVDNSANKNTATTQPVSKPPVTTTAAPEVATVNYSDPNIPAQGYFATGFGVDVAGRSLQTLSGAAMTFKTASGWSDKKYYILMNDVPPGSIVKITGPNSKYVFAKVLWNLGDMKENEGLNFRISNAAASALSISDTKFNVNVAYYE